jgi:hypothetical protein
MIANKTRQKGHEWNEMLNWIAEVEGDGGVVNSVTFPVNYPSDLVKCFQEQTKIRASRHMASYWLSMTCQLGVFDG